MTELLRQLSELTGPSGWEDAVREFVSARAASMGLRAETDPMGNLTVFKGGKTAPAQPVVLSAHLDEPGMMVKSITEEGLLKFGLTGNTDPRTILGKAVTVGESALRGIVGLKPIHLTPAEERKTMPKTGDLYLDVGAPDADWTRKQVSKGDYAVFSQETVRLGGRQLLAKAMGRSVGCAVLLELMGRELPVDVHFVMTAQRHVGNRGAYGAAARLRPALVVALDICPGSSTGETLPRLGSGPVIPAMDKGAVFDRTVTQLLKRSAETAQVPVQPWAGTEAGGDGGVWQQSCGGTKAAALYCPAKYVAAPAQVVDTGDLAAMAETLFAMLTSL